MRTVGPCAGFVPSEMPNDFKQFRVIQSYSRMELVEVLEVVT
jgi:hypothetical protein